MCAYLDNAKTMPIIMRDSSSLIVIVLFLTVLLITTFSLLITMAYHITTKRTDNTFRIDRECVVYGEG